MRKYGQLLQIGEVAAFHGISRKMLLNYENYGLLTPTLVDESSGYRYYDLIALARIGLILDLRRAGMSIADIRNYFTGKTTLREQTAKLRAQIAQIERSIEALSVREIGENSVSEVSEVTLPETRCFTQVCVGPDVASTFEEFMKFYGSCYDNGLLTPQTKIICEFPKDFFAEDFFETENIHIRFCVTITEGVEAENVIVFPATRALSISYSGNPDKSITAYDILKKYAISHSKKVIGYPREYYLEGGWGNSNGLIRIIVPIE